MSWDLAIDSDFGLFLDETGDLAVVSGADLVAQDLRVLLSTQVGEWFMDLTMGMDYLGVDPQSEPIFGKAPDLGVIRAQFAELITSVENVIRLESLDLDLDARTRLLTVTFTAVTTGETVTFTGTMSLSSGALVSLVFTPVPVTGKTVGG